MFPGDQVEILAGQNLSMTPGVDILVAQANTSETRYTIVEEYSYAAGVLTAAATHEIPTPGPPSGHTVLASDGAGRPFVALTFGEDASVTCALGPC